MSRWRAGEDVRFACSGVIGQWKTSLSGATIDMAQLALRRAGLEDLVPFS